MTGHARLGHRLRLDSLKHVPQGHRSAQHTVTTRAGSHSSPRLLTAQRCQFAACRGGNHSTSSITSFFCCIRLRQSSLSAEEKSTLAWSLLKRRQHRKTRLTATGRRPGCPVWVVGATRRLAGVGPVAVAFVFTAAAVNQIVACQTTVARAESIARRNSGIV